MIDRSSKSDSRDRHGLPNDLMSELLLCLRLNGVYCRRLHVSPPFGIRFDAVPGRAQFHFVANGEAFLRLTSGAVHRLAAGDAVLLPHGSTADLVSAPNLPATVQTRLHAMTSLPRETGRSPDRLGEGRKRQPPDQTTHVFSGCMAFDLGSLRPLIKEMPEVMLIGRLIDRQPEIDALLRAMEREVLAERIGSGGVLAHIAGVISAYIVRDWVEFGCKEGRSHDTGRWLGTLRDPRLGRVIGALHRDPGRDWTVAELATMTGISRSAFAERFLAVTGRTPLRYVAELRMRLAAEWIAEDGLAIDVAAQRLGYGSQAAFSRAFKRLTGQPPGALRAGRAAVARTPAVRAARR